MTKIWVIVSSDLSPNFGLSYCIFKCQRVKNLNGGSIHRHLWKKLVYICLLLITTWLLLNGKLLKLTNFVSIVKGGLLWCEIKFATGRTCSVVWYIATFEFSNVAIKIDPHRNWKVWYTAYMIDAYYMQVHAFFMPLLCDGFSQVAYSGRIGNPAGQNLDFNLEAQRSMYNSWEMLEDSFSWKNDKMSSFLWDSNCFLVSMQPANWVFKQDLEGTGYKAQQHVGIMKRCCTVWPLIPTLN